MPRLLPPALERGCLSARPQPRIAVDEDLHLRPWREADADAVMQAFTCPDIRRWHLRAFDDHDEALSWIAGWAERWQRESDASWAITQDATDEPVGQVGLRTIDLGESSAQLSYWVVPAARGRAVAVRAARALTEWSFEVPGFHRMFLEHSTGNRASCRVATTLGFAPEGTLRGALRHVDGWHDMHVHARLNPR